MGAAAGLFVLLGGVTATLLATVLAIVVVLQWAQRRSEQRRFEDARHELEESRSAGERAASIEVARIRAAAEAEIAAARDAAGRADDDARARVEAALAQRKRDADAEILRKTRELNERREAAVLEEGRRAERLQQLSDEIQRIEDLLYGHEVGLYRPVYAYNEPTQYQLEIEAVRAKQAAMVRDGKAVKSEVGWTVNGSASQGRQMIEREAKLMLRAFNGECDALLVKVRADNADRLIERMTKSRAAINKLGGGRNAITDEYVLLKVAELRLVHEHEQKLQLMREIERQHRERLREEQIALKEIERAQAEAAKDEERYEKALEKARAEAAAAGEAVKQALLDKIADLDAKLAEAHARTERVKSRAQMTRSGHVYVISNEGSFGNGVYKIGMTRRLEPLDRVRELGDASVPFLFDVHALIFTEDAPGLEAALHRAFAERRVNRINLKREFFRVSLLEIETEVRQHHPTAEFVHVAEAYEWRQSEAIRAGLMLAEPELMSEIADPLDALD